MTATTTLVASLVIALSRLVSSTPLADYDYDQSTDASVSSQPETEYCMTRDCINTAYNLLQNVNLSVDPCEDFYEVKIDLCSQFQYSYRLNFVTLPEEVNQSSEVLCKVNLGFCRLESLLQAILRD